MNYTKATTVRLSGEPTDEAQRKADERMRHDYPILQQFHSKHALGALYAPSCLCCGQQTGPARPIAVQHMELPAIVVCKPCKDAASGVVVLDRLETMHEHGLSIFSPAKPAGVKACPNAEHMGEHACKERGQCWEPCGELGHSAEHARIAGVLPLEVPSQHTDPSKWPSKADIDRADPRCKGCDLPNGHPEYCRCTPGVKTVDGGQA